MLHLLSEISLAGEHEAVKELECLPTKVEHERKLEEEW
jgi:hypothetical protein